MPQAYVEKLAKKHKMSVAAAEKHWSAAKKAASKEGHEEDFAYVTGIFKKMMGESVVTESKRNPFEKIINATYYVFDERGNRITIEEHKQKFFIQYDENKVVDVWADDPTPENKKRAREIKVEIMNKYKKVNKSDVTESARDKVAKAVILVQEAKVQKKLKALKASTFMEFLINEAADNPGVGDFVKFDHDGEKVEGKIARIGKNDAGKKFYTTRIVDGSLKGKVVSVDAAKCS